ncbi:MAG: hypothetical protein CMJ35_01915 [Phycisphaerae bacterium]|nr:hypothetical protein [Phycisphaerae bacterium]MBM90355.1 hypothetical protein [Phycisphaerae bacterium]HCT44212.1 hypothetical protein [Phycisphaerales bacterium]
MKICAKALVTSLLFLIMSVHPSYAGAKTSGAQGGSGVQLLDLYASDAVYDPYLDLIYASVQSGYGYPNGNSIAIIDPEKFEVIEFVPIGSEPGLLDLSSDGRKLAVSLEGALALVTLDTLTHERSAMRSLVGSSNTLMRAESIAIDPGDSNAICVSLDEIATTADGELHLYYAQAPPVLAASFSANELAFTAPGVLMTSSIGESRSLLWRFSVSEGAIEYEAGAVDLFMTNSPRIEGGADGLLYVHNGEVADPDTLEVLGRYLASGHVHVESSLDLVYYSWSSFGNQVIAQFRYGLYEELDRYEFEEDIYVDELLGAGEHGLAFVTSDGQLGLFRGFATKGRCLVDFYPDQMLNSFDVTEFILAFQAMEHRADLHRDGQWDMFDVIAFIDQLRDGC